MEITGGKNIMAVLEGGYNLESISWAAESVLRTLTGEKIPLDKSKTKKDLR
jgi:acetoin utilization deacetylase AcuC-like enzyme